MSDTTRRGTGRPVAGLMLMFIGVTHLLVGVIGFGDTFAAMAVDGLVGSLRGGPDRQRTEQSPASGRHEGTRV